MDTYLVLAGAVGAEPVGIGTTGLHLCQICTAEPYGGQSGSYVSTVDTDTASLEETGEGKATLEGGEVTAEVGNGAELPAYQTIAEHIPESETDLEFVNNPEDEFGAEDEAFAAGGELVTDAGTLRCDLLVLSVEHNSGGESHLEFADVGKEADDATTELLRVSRDAVSCAHCGIP